MFGFGRREKDPNREPLKPWQRLIGVGANILFPGAGVASNALFNGLNNRQQTPINPNTMQGWNTSPNLGFGASQYQGANTYGNTQGQINDMYQNQTAQSDAQAYGLTQARIAAARNNQDPMMGAGAGAFIQPNQAGDPREAAARAYAASNPWIRHNGLPQNANDQRMAINSMYLDGATSMANSNYGSDIGFIAPQARAPRER
jgi:hypothetical protein